MKKHTPLIELKYSAKNAEKELYSIKRNVDNMLKEPSLKRNRIHQKETPIK